MTPFGLTLKVDSLSDLMSVAPSLHDLCLKNKLVLIQGLAPLERNSFQAFAERVSPRTCDPFVAWDFGVVMELKEDPTSPNYLFSNERVPFHWDGAFHETPGIIVFNCIEAPETDGRTLFVDPSIAYHTFSTDTKAALSQTTLEYVTEKKAHYGGRFAQSILSRHPVTNELTVRYGEPVPTLKNPVTQTLQNPCKEKAEALDLLQNSLYDERFCVRHEWKPGDLLLADNHSLLHGREGFQSNQSRHIRRIQLR